MTQDWTQLVPARARELAARWRDRDVLVVGDVMLDRYLWGNVNRISPEAPVPVVEVERETVRLGGAANVSQNLRSLGARPVLVGVVGPDAAADALRADLEGLAISAESLVVDPSRPTSLKTRIVARSQHLVRADQESRDALPEPVAEQVRAKAIAALARAAVVVISDYGKGVVSPSFLAGFLPEAAARGIPVCVDPKDANFFHYRGVAVLTPNQHEAAEVLGYKLRDEASVTRAGEDILRRLDPECLLITRGERGMSLFQRGGRRTDFSTVARQVYDVTGAGDTVVSAYAVSLAGGAEPWEATWVANHAAGLVVAELGTAAPDLERLMSSFEREIG
jgi:rfaE bifunctional protein kinase chain/domain